MYNCAGDREKDLPCVLPFAPELRRCPWSVIDPEVLPVIEDYRLAKLGIWPYGGSSLGDQPQPFVEAYLACEEGNAEAEEMKHKATLAGMKGGGASHGG